MVEEVMWQAMVLLPKGDRYDPPLGVNIPIYVEPFLVEDLVPTEDNIEWAVKRLQNHCSGGPSGIRAKHLKGWLAAARKKENEAAAAKQDNPKEERMMPGPDRTGRKGTEESRKKTL